MTTPFHVTDETFQTEVLEADKPTLVDFWAERCHPCKMIAPAVKEIAAEYDDRIFEHAALFEILDQAKAALIDVLALRG